jgi:predicted RNase H-like nuclease (RuvC/YqgF family)
VKEKVAVATVEGKAYFLIVNLLRERNIPFVSLVPGDSVSAEVKVVITTEGEKPLIKHEKILVFSGENELDILVNEVEKTLQGKEAYEKIVIGVDPGEAIGFAALADGKVIEESNCFSTKELIDAINKTIKNVDFSITDVSVKIGNGVPIYKDLIEALDDELPQKVELNVVSEAGTNRPLKENRRSRGIRHISSAKRIAARTGYIFSRRKTLAADSRI